MKAIAAAVLVVAAARAHAAARLPVFLADNHAETFAWIARTFDPDQPVALVLVDAHTDATAAERSEELREQLRRVPDAAARDRRIEAWRATGRIQAFNWLEPLMPRPIDSVLWVHRTRSDDAARARATREAGDALDGRLEFEPRGAGSLARRWRTTDLTSLPAWKPAPAIILTIDLDFFAGSPRPHDDLQTLWKTAMSWPGLRGVSFSVSRPWLRDTAEADRLVAMAIDAVRRTRGADLETDASVDDRPDTSLQHDHLAATGRPIPRWDLASAAPDVRYLLGTAPATWRVTDRRRPPAALNLTNQPAATITACGHPPDCDGVVRVTGTDGGLLRVEPAADTTATGRVRWFVRVSAQAAYHLMPDTGLGKGFATAPGRWIYERRIPIGETTDFTLTATAWRGHLDPTHHCGRVIVEADCETADGWLPVREIDLRVSRGTGFRAALSECFGMPYAFGIALCAEADRSGVDTGWGADCSNILAHAWRRCGVPAPWGDPAALCRGLTPIATAAGPDTGVRFTPLQLESGLIVDFGGHVAALWEDRPPVGVLDGGDLLAHHLGGRPETLTLSELARHRPPFAVRVLPDPPPCRLAIAGDVVPTADALGLTELTAHAAGADLVLANLEGIPSAHPPDQRPVYDFRFPPTRIALLRQAGIQVVSLANNHAADAGADGITAGRQALEAAGLGVVGGGRDLATALRPWRATLRGHALAVFGVCAVTAPAAGDATPGVLKLPDHAAALAAALAGEVRAGVTPIVLIHWGTEFQDQPDDDQLHWARWLTARGARIVAGSGPHRIQRTDAHAGGLIHYSLGNAVYPSPLAPGGSGAIWTIDLAPPASPRQLSQRVLSASP